MSFNTVTRRFTFEAAHRLMDYPGKCRHIHGHSYVAEVEVEALPYTRALRAQDGERFPELDALGMVADFGLVKQKVGFWIDDQWDHNIILHPKDPLLGLAKEDRDLVFMGKDPYVMSAQWPNPTAEHMTMALYVAANEVLRREGIGVVQVRIRETEACSACYAPRS